MTFTYAAYSEILEAMGDDIRSPRRIGERSHTAEAIARHREPCPRISGWTVKPDVPAKMELAALVRQWAG